VTRIQGASLRMIFDSRGRPTVEATIRAESGVEGRAGAPSGASTGATEVQAFPPGGVAEALATFGAQLRPRLLGLEVGDQRAIDGALHTVDGTNNFSRIGGNTATAISVASALTHARESHRELWQLVRGSPEDGPVFPGIVGNCINGGRHAIGGPDIQEFIAYSTAPRPMDAIRAAVEVHRTIGETLHRRFPKYALGRGDEGGWVAPLGNLEAVELLAESCAEVRDRLHLPVHPGLDLAASEFYRDGMYRYQDQTVDPGGQLGFVTHLIDRFGLRYVEDPFDQEAFESFAELTRTMGKKALIVGDDIFTTSVARLERGLNPPASNAVLIKVNQVGTLTDTLATIDLAGRHGLATVTSHRSGEVPDSWLAHLAIGFGSVGLKCGVLGGERVAKLNELLRLAAATESTTDDAG
jgi:enolase